MFEVDGMNLITGGRLVGPRGPVREVKECGGQQTSGGARCNPTWEAMGGHGTATGRREFA
jgi:hypothetical protein